MYIEYGDKELEYLKSKDKLLAEVIDKVGIIKRKKDEDFFSSVVYHIIGQQISIKAQKTIWNRLQEKIEIVDYKGILSITSKELQSIGLSFRKTEYILDFAQKINNKELIIEKLETLDDNDLVKELIKLKGIGKWTAEMIMTFCLDRKNIISFDDLAIHRGLRMLYHHRNIDIKKFNKYKRRYSPYSTVASLYLWEIASGKVEGMKDYAPKKKLRKKLTDTIEETLILQNNCENNTLPSNLIDLTENEMYTAVIENDENYDGIFFYAVKSTGVYCKPSCKSKEPLKENIEYFKSSEEALSHGYRACKRCRSDLLEYEPVKQIAIEVKTLINKAFITVLEDEQKLSNIGISRKRLVQIFKQHYGITPAQYTKSLRLKKSKELLLQTDMKVIDIAYSVGFKSLSAFYDFFDKNLHITPLKYRKEMKKNE